MFFKQYTISDQFDGKMLQLETNSEKVSNNNNKKREKDQKAIKTISSQKMVKITFERVS